MANKRARGTKAAVPAEGAVRKVRRNQRGTFQSGRVVAEIERKGWDHVTKEHGSLVNLFDLIISEISIYSDLKTYKKSLRNLGAISSTIEALEFKDGTSVLVSPYHGDVSVNKPSATNPGWFGDIALISIPLKNEYRNGSTQKDGSSLSGDQVALTDINSYMTKVVKSIRKLDEVKSVELPTSEGNAIWATPEGYVKVMLAKSAKPLFLVPTWELTSLATLLNEFASNKRGINLNTEIGSKGVIERLSVPLIVGRRVEEIAREQPLLMLAFEAIHQFCKIQFPMSMCSKPFFIIQMDAVVAQFASKLPASKGTLESFNTVNAGAASAMTKEESRDALDLFMLTVHNLGATFSKKNSVIWGDRPIELVQSSDEEDSSDEDQSEQWWGYGKSISLYMRYPVEPGSVADDRFRVNIAAHVSPKDLYYVLFQFRQGSQLLDRGLSCGKDALFVTMRSLFSEPQLEQGYWDGAVQLTLNSMKQDDDTYSLVGSKYPSIDTVVSSILSKVLPASEFEGFYYDESTGHLKFHLSSKALEAFREHPQYLIGPTMNTESALQFSETWEPLEVRVTELKMRDAVRLALKLFDDAELKSAKTLPSPVGMVSRIIQLRLEAMHIADDFMVPSVAPLYGNAVYHDDAVTSGRPLPGNDISGTPWEHVHYWINEETARIGGKCVAEAICLAQRWLWKIGAICPSFNPASNSWRPATNVWLRALIISASIGASGFHWSSKSNRRTPRSGESIFYAFLDLLCKFPFGQSEDSKPFILPVGYLMEDISEETFKLRVHEAQKQYVASRASGTDNMFAICSIHETNPIYLPVPSGIICHKILEAASAIVERHRKIVLSPVTTKYPEFSEGENPTLVTAFNVSKKCTMINTFSTLRLKNILVQRQGTPAETCRLDYLANGCMPPANSVVDDEPNHMVIGSLHSLIATSATNDLVSGSVHAVNPLGKEGLNWTNKKPSLRMAYETTWNPAIKWSSKLDSASFGKLIKLKYDVVTAMVEQVSRTGEFALGLEASW